MHFLPIQVPRRQSLINLLPTLSPTLRAESNLHELNLPTVVSPYTYMTRYSKATMGAGNFISKSCSSSVGSLRDHQLPLAFSQAPRRVTAWEFSCITFLLPSRRRPPPNLSQIIGVHPFTSAVRYSRMAALYTAAVAPTRPWLVVLDFRCR